MADNKEYWLNRMQEDWDMRAKRDYLHWTVNAVPEGAWDVQEYLDTGEGTLYGTLDTFLESQGRDPATMKAFEIGCGAGRITSALARRFKSVSGLDVSGEMVKAARQMVASQGYENVKLWQGDGCTLEPQKDNSVDLVCSVIVFQHVPNVELQLGYLEEVGRILKRGGLFAISLYNDLPGYQHALSWWGRARAEHAVSSNELVNVTLDNYETSMQTYTPCDVVEKTIQESGMQLISDAGRGTSIWWIYGAKL
jgi:SAM-dependent methyltransferase